jgi:plasmid stability protein
MDTSKRQHRKITVQLPEALIEAMKAQAAAHRRSLTGEIAWALQEYLSRQQQQPAEREK